LRSSTDANGELINVLDARTKRAPRSACRASLVIDGDANSDLNNDGVFGGPGEI
jgi:hypothetical protein